jgi:hypothetical protein
MISTPNNRPDEPIAKAMNSELVDSSKKINKTTPVIPQEVSV